VTFGGRHAHSILRGYADHLNTLLSNTITQRRLITQSSGNGTRARIQFLVDGLISYASIRTRFGPLRLELGQHLAVGRHDANLVLTTTAYRYTLGRDDDSDAVVRWESDQRLPDEMVATSQFHLQGDILVALSRRHPPVSLNEFHLPTGWVPIEEVIRFCIVDLGVTPLSDDWDAKLRESRRLTRDLQSG
jgi:hypothetical protein